MAGLARATLPALLLLALARADGARAGEEDDLSALLQSGTLVVNASASGACEAADFDRMNSKGGGHADGSFPAVMAKCSRSSVSLSTMKTDVDKLSKCLSPEVALTLSCVKCFADNVDAGIKKCMAVCFVSWCSDKCLACNEVLRPTL
eukprot:CAMPEP_0168361306 /NCGR_PEP_ID=MMETSP0228-20121227/2600_1 /TAXON_ID=133427 /ORGANISM="Protoceratium reticulatum, Strain CCCM 535 (=CCMP 1889)" /LENGTH=147 /DNA_ID=CAMNT_0008373983 /DNA_START=16 /DNA_END=456 /DNA_ORIENTATION=-